MADGRTADYQPTIFFSRSFSLPFPPANDNLILTRFFSHDWAADFVPSCPNFRRHSFPLSQAASTKPPFRLVRKVCKTTGRMFKKKAFTSHISSLFSFHYEVSSADKCVNGNGSHPVQWGERYLVHGHKKGACPTDHWSLSNRVKALLSVA